MHAILHKVLHDAERKRLVAHNIAAFATPPSSERCRAPEMKVWTPGQLRTFLDRTAEHHHGALFRLAALVGCAAANSSGSGGTTSTSTWDGSSCATRSRR